MYYKERKMEAERQQFIYRMGHLPMVKAAYEQAAAAYVATKNYNRLLNSTLQIAEDSVKYASGTDSVKKIVHSPLITAANNIAVSQLDKLEEKYPTIKKEPNELWDAGKEYYEQTRVKGGLDKLYAVKDFSAAKVDDTKKYCHSIVAGDVTVFDVISDASRIALLALNGLLDYSDELIDKYVAVEGPSKRDPEDIMGYQRVQMMSSKAYNGLKCRSLTKCAETKEYVMKTLGDLHVAVLLMEYARNTAAWANEKAGSAITATQEQTRNMWAQIQARAETLGKQSEMVLLHVVQGLASATSFLSDEIVKYSNPFLPEGVQNKLTAAVTYAHEMNDSFSKAKTLGDLRDEVIGEAKAKIALVQDGLVNAMDYLVDVPPVSWLALDPANDVELNEELITLDRDTRRPGTTQPIVLPPIIEPRHEEHAHCG